MSSVSLELARLWELRQADALSEQQYKTAVDVVLGITQPTPCALPRAIPAAATPRWPRAELFSGTTSPPPAHGEHSPAMSPSWRSRTPMLVQRLASPSSAIAQQRRQRELFTDAQIERGLMRSRQVLTETTPPLARPPPMRSPITTRAGASQARSHYQIIANARRGLHPAFGCY